MEKLEMKFEEAEKLGYEMRGGTLEKYHGNDVDIKIPHTVGGIEVTNIGKGAFINKGIESVVIPDTVKCIEFAAFLRNDLREVVIPESVKSIEDTAFMENKLTLVEIKNKKTNKFSNNVFAVNGEDQKVILGMIKPGTWKVDDEENIWIDVND